MTFKDECIETIKEIGSYLLIIGKGAVLFIVTLFIIKFISIFVEWLFGEASNELVNQLGQASQTSIFIIFIAYTVWGLIEVFRQKIKKFSNDKEK